jgi:hypothetical protein
MATAPRVQVYRRVHSLNRDRSSLCLATQLWSTQAAAPGANDPFRMPHAPNSEPCRRAYPVPKHVVR